VPDDSGWLESLRNLGDQLAAESAQSGLGPALDLLVDHLPARAAVLVLGSKIAAERGYPPGPDAELGRRPALELEQLVRERARFLDVPDTRRGPFARREDGVHLHTSGYTAARVTPLLQGDRVLGALIVWFDELFRSARAQNSILGLVSAMLSTAVARDQTPQPMHESLASLGEINRLASLGLQLEGSTHALRSPTSSLVIQIDELRHFTSELGFLLDPSDAAASEVLSALTQTVEDMAIASAAVRRELSRLTEISDPVDTREIIQMSLLVHEALAIARPELEQRGFTVEEFVSHDGSLEGDRHNLLQLLLGLLFAIGRDQRIASQNPVLEIHLDKNPSEILVRIAAVTRLRQEIASVPSAPDNCMRIASMHGGDVVGSAGTLEMHLPTEARAPISSQVGASSTRIKRVLLVDDDPMFARALRRALKPHDVRISATAAEAEIALIGGEFVPDLVVCDLWLPGSSGRALHERIAKSFPSLAPRFVFVSGAPVTSRDGDYFKRAGCPYLTKPIQVDELVGILNQEHSWDAPSERRQAITRPERR